MRRISPISLWGLNCRVLSAPRRNGSAASAGRGRGFSLLELVLVLAIIVTLAAIAAPRYGASAARYGAEFAARRIAADLEWAQTKARTSSTSQTVQFSIGLNQYQVFDTGPTADTSGSYVVNLSDPPCEATLLSVDLGGDGKLVFDGWGMPDSGGSVTISAGREKRTVLIDADTGRATVQ